MQNTELEAAYLERLGQSLKNITFDWAGGEPFPFEALFYPLEIDDGKYAFQSYTEQMELARRHAESGGREPAAPARPKNARRRVSADRERKTWFMPQLLWKDDTYFPGSLVVPKAQDSRILAVASAGHGKTTLLRRVALYFCHPESRSAAHLEIGEKYRLRDAALREGERIIPCLIRLRDITDGDYYMPRVIENSVASVFARESGEAEEELTERLRDWLSEARDRLLLLVDGLDELSNDARYFFLLALDDYFIDFPDTRVIMTSRAAGLSEIRIQDVLQKMWFRGRSILPLTDRQAEQYAKKWIAVTQPGEQQAQMRAAVDQIMTQDRFRYLKEFMRTPLELLLILKQTLNDTFSVNRFQMFNDTLWEVFTGHEKQFGRKRAVFEDTMTLLGFLAYQMQLRDSMYLSVADLEVMAGDFDRLSFHTDLVKNGAYWDVLNSLAANVGIVERDDRTDDVAYTFPIRAYQEFLAAHACCHLRLNEEKSRPDPSGILEPHLDDSRWINIINFALSDLGTTSQREFDRIINLLFGGVSDLEQLRAVVEADLPITKEHAEALCRNIFAGRSLPPARQALLVAAMGTKSAYAYSYALKSLYGADRETFLEAYALSAILWEYSAGRSAYEKAIGELCAGSAERAALGAEMISLMARTVLDEISEAYRPVVVRDLRITHELVMILENSARIFGDLHSVAALTDLWISRAEHHELAARALNAERKRMVVQAMESMAETARQFCAGGDEAVEAEELKRLRNLIQVLGSFPVTEENLAHGVGNHWIRRFMESMLIRSYQDQIAAAAAMLFYNWSLAEFLKYWDSAIHVGELTAAARREVYSPRENRHYELVNEGLSQLAPAEAP